VRVEKTDMAEIFQYTVLSASRADDLTKWLNENKYFVPIGAERVLDHYVGCGWRGRR
jgi:hypothetical protein